MGLCYATGEQGEEKKHLNTCSFPKVSLKFCFPSHVGSPSGPLHCFATGKEVPCLGVASPREGSSPILCPLKILETPSTLSSLGLGEPLILLGGAISPQYGGSKKTKPRDSVSSLWFLSLSLAYSFLLLESSPATFHQSGSQLTSAESLSSETPTSC